MSQVTGCETCGRMVLLDPPELWRLEALGQMAAGIAHDFKNVLVVVMCSAELIRERIDETSEIYPDVAAILQASARGQALVSQLMTVARRQQPEREVVDLNEVVREVVDMLSRVIDDRITVVQRLTPDGAAVWANRTQLEQVVLNLLLNAREAIPERLGSIVLSTSRQGERTRLRVADNGDGMTDAVRRRIFDPLFTTKAASGGCGVGLANVDAIVRSMNGSIRVESTPDVGSTFELDFPGGDVRMAGCGA